MLIDFIDIDWNLMYINGLDKSKHKAISGHDSSNPNDHSTPSSRVISMYPYVCPKQNERGQ